ncbi:AraC family transcriptional regulator [Rhodopseudomonas thermotolerans]|uniref:AraC family transcriptional regulator n=2 Tax=Rhodopseudomonas TaxID=1073 RepID=A0A336JP77_9BRAD|nr:MULTISPECIES: AraC family transcriptional regulator [Rhodopseudomonas]RED37736.1 AraC family transcriptional regulator [Rhodopseudomonas pentothenatexigens]REG04470.1 AraC family transcriptional regulator [Rhodopseudomonas thermotolerans]SSW90236.1 AraC family transcriptional regulator [Rhodopseudomonas pentothenatexigens]
MLSDRQRKVVSADDLKRLAGATDSAFRLVTPGLAGSSPILVGEFRRIHLRQGLTLHTTDTREIHDLHTEAAQPPGLTVALFLQGCVRVCLGGQPMELGSTEGAHEIEAIAIARSRFDSFARQSVRGAHIRKVNVTLSPEWLDQEALADSPACAEALRFLRGHLATRRWKATPRLIAIAEQILNPPPLAGPLERLYLESRSIEMVADALQAITDASACFEGAVLHPAHRRCVQRACSFIDAHLDQELTLQTISAAAGLNPGSLQRGFRVLHGTTIFDYVRGRKLDYAREMLERDTLSIGEVAHMVGYRTLGNFSTAFRRRFGISPRQIRARY